VIGPLWALDGVIAGSLVGLAVLTLISTDLFRAIVLFIALGLVMAIAWARLQAVDIALAEAAIGAGLTGALFLNALGRTGSRGTGKRVRPVGRRARLRAAGAFAVPLVALWLAVIIGVALSALPRDRAGVLAHVTSALPESGVANPVTAVLLNFRAYDTLLEVAVLLLALIGVWSLPPAPRSARNDGPPGPVLMGLVYVLVPASGVVGGYLLWTGTSAPGGAFQAGAVLAASGVLVLVAGLMRPGVLRLPAVRLTIVLGAAAFLGMGVAGIAAGGALLEYPSTHAGAAILVIEVLLTMTIALVLVALVADGAAAGDDVEGRQ
jgi:multisubunit Na+/H+ antiporter MnhB subunit